MYLNRCYRNGLDFRGDIYPLELLNFPFYHHYITVDNLVREFTPFADNIRISYRITEANATVPYRFNMGIPMLEFERRMLSWNHLNF